MAQGLPILPVSVNTNVTSQLLPPNVARFIKNLTNKKGANGTETTSIGLNEDILKPLQANELYGQLNNVPLGTNYVIGARWWDTVNEVYVWCWNSKGNHFVYRIRCYDGVVEMVKVDKNFNFKLNPENFIHENGCWLEPVKIIDPFTGETLIKRDLYFTDAENFQRYLRVDDCIASNGFDPALYPYFSGTYDPNIPISMGVPSLDYCIGVQEIPITGTANELNNELLYQTWKFRAKGTDVFGRPSEHGIIAFYKPGINDCLASSDNVPRCLTLTVIVDNPFIDTVDIEYLNDNGTVWYKTETVYLYQGSAVGQWWLRPRNPNIIFDNNTNQLSVIFCDEGEHQAVPTTETSRLDNPLPNKSVGMVKLTKRLGLFNNWSGFNPLPQDLLNKIKLSIEYPAINHDTDLVELDIWVVIFNPMLNNFQEVREDGTNGYIWGDNNSKHHGARNYLQFFRNIAQSGFYGYLNDGDSVISKQYYLNGAGVWVLDSTFNGISLSPTGLTAQRFTFTNKKKGTYIFRLAGTEDPTVTPNMPGTSTTVWGLCPYTVVNNKYSINTNGRLPYQEVFINACNGSYSTLKDGNILAIADLASFSGGLVGFSSHATKGYINEAVINGVPEYPMELMTVTSPVSGVGQETNTSQITDHNGFYWFVSRTHGHTFTFHFINKCAPASFSFGDGDTGIREVDITMNGIIPFNGSVPLFPDFNTALCNRVLITGQAFLEGTNIGVSNAIITLTRGASAITDNNGNFSIVAHDDFLNYRTGRNDQLVFGSSCIYFENGGCVQAISVHITPCATCDAVRTVNTAGWLLTTNNFAGLLSGGSYRVGICPADWLGRRPFIQDIGPLVIPTVAQTGVIAPCKVRAVIDTSVILPSVFKWFTFWITAELNNADYIEWIVDEVVFINNTGQTDNVNPSQIKIMYSSLQEFNKQNNYSTTCGWNFIVPNSNNPVTGDKVQFIINGDGTIFPNSIISLVKYDGVGQYFLIDYKPSLANLQANAKIRLVHPKASYSDAEPYFEICDSRVDLINGVPEKHTLYINAADTYYLSRAIPVPTSANNLTQQVLEQTSTASGSITTTTATTRTENVSYVNELRTLGFYFEHHSPSNFWGRRAWNYGRVNVRNINEAEQINYNQIALSGEILPTGILSYLQYFDTALMINFDVVNSGGIVAALVMPGRVLFVCKTMNFIIGYNDNLLRQTAEGTISASAQNGFGQPDYTADWSYGVQLRDKNSVVVIGDMIIFVDTLKGELIGLRPTNPGGSIHFTKSQHDLIFIAKIKSMIGTNRYFHAGFDPLTDDYLLSDFNLDVPVYDNQLRWYNSNASETLVFDKGGAFLGQRSFVGEWYAGADGDLKNKQFFAFKNGLPFNHYNITQNNLFNTFFGIAGERVLVIVGNGQVIDEKNFHWIEVYSKYLFYSPEIKTDSGQLSRLAKSAWLRTVKFYKASFKSDLLTPDVNNMLKNKLFDGNKLYGRNVQVTLVGDSKDNQTYTPIAGIIIFSTKLEKSGFR